MDYLNLWNLAVEIPVVIVFVWFSLRLVGTFVATLEKRDHSQQEFISTRDKAWQDFLEHQRVEDRKTMMSLGDTIKDIGAKVSQNRELMEGVSQVIQMHDAHFQAAQRKPSIRARRKQP